MSLLEEVSAILEAAGIRNALIGTLALSAYGINRATVNLDLFAADASCLKPELWAGLRSRGIGVEVRRADLVLLKLYAGGLQDAWDVQQLLTRPFREDLIREVESQLSELPARCQDLWKKILQG